MMDVGQGASEAMQRFIVEDVLDKLARYGEVVVPKKGREGGCTAG